MTTTRPVVVLVLVVIVGFGVAPVASGAVDSFVASETSEAESSTNASVVTFMQSSAANAENEVDAEMFSAKYDAADDEERADIVLERTAELEERLDALEAEREKLREQKTELHPGEYQARMTQLTVEIRALEREIDRTERRAAETGVDGAKLAELRENASELAGPEVAAMAQELAGIDDVPGNAAGNSGNGTDDNPGQEHGQGNDQNQEENADENPPENGESGPPDDKGPGGNKGSDGTSDADA